MTIENNHNQQQRKRIEASPSSSQSAVTLLTEIIIQILSKLPVDSLLRCRSVCKLWHSIISDPYFIKSHLIIMSTNYTHHRLFITTQISYLDYIQNFNKAPKVNFKTCHLYDMLYDSSINGLEHYYPPKPLRELVCVVGSCNGLICMANEEDGLLLLNPSTREFNALPYFGEERPVGWLSLYGFGYDESTDDYKVVKLYCHVRDRRTKAETVWIYSLRNGNWKKVGDFPLLDYGTFSNGALHWVGCKDFGSSNSCTIVSLELANETCGEVLLPVCDEGEKSASLGCLRELLCVLCKYRGSRLDFWVMKAYGVKDSWTKLV